MKAVLSIRDELIVTFENKVTDPWAILSQIVSEVPEISNKPVRFSTKIPEASRYLLYKSTGNELEVKETNQISEAIKFLKPKRPFRTLGELLKKYAAK